MKRSGLGAFVAKKGSAAENMAVAANQDVPVAEPVTVEKEPAKTAAIKVEKAEPVEMVPLNFRVPAADRRELKIYAAKLGIPMLDIVKEGIKLHMKKHGGRVGGDSGTET